MLFRECLLSSPTCPCSSCLSARVRQCSPAASRPWCWLWSSSKGQHWGALEQCPAAPRPCWEVLARLRHRRDIPCDVGHPPVTSVRITGRCIYDISREAGQLAREERDFTSCPGKAIPFLTSLFPKIPSVSAAGSQSRQGGLGVGCGWAVTRDGIEGLWGAKKEKLLCLPARKKRSFASSSRHVDFRG